jgi:hypothetical protein
MQLSEDVKEDVTTIGKLVLYKNSLIFKNTAYQISNISSIWVADHSYTIKHKFPNWIWVVGILGVLAILLGLQQNWMAVVIGLGLLGVAYYGYKSFKPSTAISKFALGMELNSGRRQMFTAEDQDFVQRAAKELLEALADKRTDSEKVVMNFDNKSINIETVTGSTIIGGNVSNSLVENI